MSTAPTPRVGIPLRPDPLARDREQRRSLIRAIASVAMSGEQRADRIVARAWPSDNLAGMIVKAALAGPMTTTSTGLPAVTSIDVLPSLAPQSAAVRLFARCMRVNLDGVSQVSVPRGAPGVIPVFVGEGKPAPVIKLSFTDTKIGPVRKILVASAVTNELENLATEAASRALADAAATRSFDAIVFDAGADDGIRPAGLLHGLTPLTPPNPGTGLDAISGDLGNLAASIASAGIDTDDLIIVASPRQAIRLKLLSGPSFDYTVLSSSAIPDKRVIAIAASAVASGYSGLPSIEKSPNPVFHYEDTNPQNIGLPGAPPVVASPALSAFQADLIAIRVRLWAAYGVIAPGGVAYMDAVNW